VVWGKVNDFGNKKLLQAEIKMPNPLSSGTELGRSKFMDFGGR